MTSTNYLHFFLVCFATVILCIVEANNDGQDATVSMIFTGDISFDGPVKYFAEIPKSCNYRRIFDKVKPFLDEADLRIGNLESPLFEKPYGLKPALAGKAIYHYGSINAVDGLKYAGFNVMQLANNHMSDFDSKGVESTTKALKNAGIDYVGLRSDHDRMKSQIPLIKVVNGIKIGFLAYCHNKEGCDLYQCKEDECGNSSNVFRRGPAILNKKIALNDITALNNKVDRVVVLLHWSREYSLTPPTGIRDIARLLTIYGANLIIGGHPHVIQGHECQRSDALSVYSMGNFVFPKAGIKHLSSFLGGRRPDKKNVRRYIKSMKNWFSPTQFSYIFRITVNKTDILRAEYLPLEIKNEPNTNCLQPAPISTKWISFCSFNDIYCYDFRNQCASSTDLEEQLNAPPRREDYCIKDRLH